MTQIADFTRILSSQTFKLLLNDNTVHQIETSICHLTESSTEKTQTATWNKTKVFDEQCLWGMGGVNKVKI